MKLLGEENRLLDPPLKKRDRKKLAWELVDVLRRA